MRGRPTGLMPGPSSATSKAGAKLVARPRVLTGGPQRHGCSGLLHRHCTLTAPDGFALWWRQLRRSPLRTVNPWVAGSIPTRGATRRASRPARPTCRTFTRAAPIRGGVQGEQAATRDLRCRRASSRGVGGALSFRPRGMGSPGASSLFRGSSATRTCKR
jgi:hypothetical protein